MIESIFREARTYLVQNGTLELSSGDGETPGDDGEHACGISGVPSWDPGDPMNLGGTGIWSRIRQQR